MHKWQLHEAKNKLSNLIDTAMQGKAQCITKRGEEAVVVISMKEYQRLKEHKVSLKDYLVSGNKFDNLLIKRAVGRARDAGL